mmetsp:Transcript_78595/g.228114  ORF Transcript_78595/g.228114 Transcript_78595/m.228114 type:complete len:242 (-) Transcript_78595:259-984(-)
MEGDLSEQRPELAHGRGLVAHQRQLVCEQWVPRHLHVRRQGRRRHKLHNRRAVFPALGLQGLADSCCLRDVKNIPTVRHGAHARLHVEPNDSASRHPRAERTNRVDHRGGPQAAGVSAANAVGGRRGIPRRQLAAAARRIEEQRSIEWRRRHRGQRLPQLLRLVVRLNNPLHLLQLLDGGQQILCRCGLVRQLHTIHPCGVHLNPAESQRHDVLAHPRHVPAVEEVGQAPAAEVRRETYRR